MACDLPVVCGENISHFFILDPPSYKAKADEAKLVHEMCFLKMVNDRRPNIYEHWYFNPLYRIPLKGL